MQKNQLSFFLLVAAIIAAPAPVNAQLPTGWRAHDLNRPRPPVVSPGESNLPARAPSDAIVLFDGTELSQWVDGEGRESRWKIVDGAMESVAGAGYIFTKEKFGDCQLHVEWATPKKVEGNGQGRGNSGVYLMGKFEVQVLDSYENDTYADGSAGALYGQYPPLVNVSRAPGEWQSYDIIFRKPRFDADGNVTSPATITVLHNGVLIQNHENLFGPTDWIQHAQYHASLTEGPLGLQDHGNPVRFRNIWIRPLEERSRPEQPYRSENVNIDLSDEQKQRLVGEYDSFSIRQEGENLYLQHLGRPLELVPLSETEFEFRRAAGKITFSLDEQGQVKSASGVVDAAGRFSANKK